MKRSTGLKPSRKRMKSRHRAIGSATPAQQAYQDRARELGCVMCLLRLNPVACGPVRIHHRTVGDLHGQLQLGHDHIVALGDWHHQGVPHEGLTVEQMRIAFGPSFHHHKKQFMAELVDRLGERSTSALQRLQDALLEQRGMG
jgi:hypothetical protein